MEKEVYAEDRVERLGRYFVHMQIASKYRITFEQFVRMVDSGRWEEMQRCG